MQYITKEELQTKLSNLRASTAVSIQTETLPKLLKSNRTTGEACPYEEGDISKVGIMGGLIGCRYANRVNNQLGREDKDLNFRAQPRKWGTLMDNRVLVHHINKQGEENYYIEMHVLSSQRPIYLWGDTEINVEELRHYLPKKDAPHTQENLEKKIVLRDVKLSNIKRIKIGGELYVVGDPNDLPSVEAVKEQTEKYEGRMTQDEQTAHDFLVEEGLIEEGEQEEEEQE